MNPSGKLPGGGMPPLHLEIAHCGAHYRAAPMRACPPTSHLRGLGPHAPLALARPEGDWAARTPRARPA
jgi:hypothetical protein